MATTTTSILTELTRVRYVGQDFQTYEDEAKEYLQKNYPDEYNDFVDNSMGLAMIQLVAYASQGLAFYINRRTTDLYMQTAQSPNSIAKNARMLNYAIEGSSVAAADITVTLTAAATYPIYIPKGFKFSGPNGLVFEYRNSEPVKFDPGELSKTFTVYEGETMEDVFVSDGTDNQVYKLTMFETSKYLVAASVEFYVGNEEWVEKTQIPYSIGNFYEVDYISRPATIRTGDGIAGTKPAQGKEIRIRYIVGSGSGGRVGSGQIDREAEPLVINNVRVGLIVTNAKPSSGGDDAEDLRKVKALAPQFFQSQDRAISKKDYDAIVNTYPGVAKGDAQIVRSVADDVAINYYIDSIRNSVSGCVSGVVDDVQYLSEALLVYLDETMTSACRGNTVQVSLLQVDANNNYVSPTSGLLEEVRQHLQARADAVHVVRTVDGAQFLVPVTMNVRVKVNKNAVVEDVLALARDALLKYNTQPYGLLVLREYGASLYMWEVNKAIRDAQVNDTDIDYANIYITGPSDHLDASGNLVISKSEIIVPGTVTVSAIA